LSIEFFIFSIFGLIFGTYFLFETIMMKNKLKILNFFIVLCFLISIILNYISIMDDKYYLLSYLIEHNYENKYIEKRFKKEIYQLKMLKCKEKVKKELNIKEKE
jgi:uncharacterized membrane protein (UPF0182 family)